MYYVGEMERLLMLNHLILILVGNVVLWRACEHYI